MAAKALELVRITQELNNLLQFLLGLVDASHVVKGDAFLALGEQLSARLTKAHRLTAATLHLAHEEYPHRDNEDHR